MTNKKNNIIKREIIKTIVFFDLFDHPLSAQEIWQNLGIECELKEVEKVLKPKREPRKLQKIDLLDFVESENHFYFLASRAGIIKTRELRENYASRKLKRARQVAAFFKFVPWIKMIAVGNVIGAFNLKDESDIDFFIVTQKKRVWITRFVCAGFMAMARLRPSPGQERDKICLSFYATEEALNLERFQLKQKGIEKDIYFIYWLAGLVPIYNQGDAYQKFIEQNQWLKKYLPNYSDEAFLLKDVFAQFSCFCSQRSIENMPFTQKLISFSHKAYMKILDIVFGPFERTAKRIQLKNMSPKIKALANQDTRVIINDVVLKLHVNDRREMYYKKWEEKLRKLGAR